MWVSRVIWIGRLKAVGRAEPGRIVPRLAVLGLALLGLAGCGGPSNMIAATAVVGASVASVAAIGRTPVDAVYSLVTGRDCSIVRWDEGKSYCRPIDPPPERQPFCTRSLGSVNCWSDPASLPDHPVGVGEAPAQTAEQEAYRVRTWPWW